MYLYIDAPRISLNLVFGWGGETVFWEKTANE